MFRECWACCDRFCSDRQTLCSAEDLDGEGVHLPQEVVHLFASVLVNGGADGPDEAEDEPELHHPTQVFWVRGIYLRKATESHIVFLTGHLYKMSAFVKEMGAK